MECGRSYRVVVIRLRDRTVVRKSIEFLENKNDPPITSEGVELVPLRLLTPHLLTLPIRLRSVPPPFVGVTGTVVVEPEAAIKGITETEG